MTNRGKSALCGPAEASARLPWRWLAMARRPESEQTLVLSSRPSPPRTKAPSGSFLRNPLGFSKINTPCGPGGGRRKQQEVRRQCGRGPATSNRAALRKGRCLSCEDGPSDTREDILAFSADASPSGPPQARSHAAARAKSLRTGPLRPCGARSRGEGSAEWSQFSSDRAQVGGAQRCSH